MSEKQTEQTEQQQWEAWQAQGPKIQRQRQKQAVIDPVLDLADKLRQWGSN